MSVTNHPYHLVELSWWPILTSFSLLLLALGGVMFMHDYPFGGMLLSSGIATLIFCVFRWWRDIAIESRKYHTNPVQNGLKLGMIIFIISELIFFGAIFASFFWARLNPINILDGFWVIDKKSWSLDGIEMIDAWDIPFINTLILLLSSTSVSWAEYAIKKHNYHDFKKALLITVILGIIFTSMQFYEYHHAGFGMSDGIYASNFYLATGFHGMHVIIGTIFLSICLIRANRLTKSHLSFEFASWYWHFVDVVWVFLFIFMYVFSG